MRTPTTIQSQGTKILTGAEDARRRERYVKDRKATRLGNLTPNDRNTANQVKHVLVRQSPKRPPSVEILVCPPLAGPFALVVNVHGNGLVVEAFAVPLRRVVWLGDVEVCDRTEPINRDALLMHPGVRPPHGRHTHTRTPMTRGASRTRPQS